jgi:tetratricopeptide (TPR) repeat protein
MDLGQERYTVQNREAFRQLASTKWSSQGKLFAVGRPAPTHVDDPASLGRRLRTVRAERGLSMVQLAFPGCSAAYVCRIEAGERVPSPRILAELARRLGVTIAELAGRADDGSIAPARIGLAEMAVRMGAEDAADIMRALAEEARTCGDMHAHSRAIEGLGQLAIEARDDERAVSLLEEARALEPAATARLRPALYESLGRAYAGIGDLSRAISVLRSALEETRRPPADLRGVIRFGVYLASAYTDQGRFADAEAVLADVLDVEASITDPVARTRVLWAMARTYAEQGRLRLAERYMGEVVARLEVAEHTLLLGRAHAVLGSIMADQRRPGEAETHLRRAGELMQAAGATPELATLSADRGRAALLAGDVEGAREAARLALAETGATEPGVAGSATLVLARAALHDGDLDEARFLCRSAIDLLEHTAAPRYVAEANQVLALVEQRAGNLPAALDALWSGLGAVDQGVAEPS